MTRGGLLAHKILNKIFSQSDVEHFCDLRRIVILPIGPIEFRASTYPIFEVVELHGVGLVLKVVYQHEKQAVTAAKSGFPISWR